MGINQTPTNSRLQEIRNKVRLLTRSPSEAQLTTAALDQYINTSILYDFPETLRLFNLRTTFSFYTQPNVALYDPATVTDPNEPLYDFLNKYTAIFPPLYVAGIQIQFTQSEQEFFGYWPKNQFITSVGQGDGTTTLFTGAVSNIPLLRDNVNFTTIDANGIGLIAYDVPTIGTNLTGVLFDSATNIAIGSINYITGDFSINWLTPPAANTPVRSQSFSYMAAIPTVMLFYDGKFQFRPVPDQSYKVTFEADAQPAQLLSAGEVPKLSEWWQYISYLSAKKIFEDRMDMDSVQQIMPELKNQERLCLRRTNKQNSNNRAPSIYNHGSAPYNWGNQYYGQF